MPQTHKNTTKRDYYPPQSAQKDVLQITCEHYKSNIMQEIHNKSGKLYHLDNLNFKVLFNLALMFS